MPSSLHEALIQLFRHRPSLATELIDALGVTLRDYQQIRLESDSFADVTPTEYRADAVVVTATGDAPVLAVVVEVQLRRDGDKFWTWPVYLATLRARLRCPAVLLVICVDVATAGWCGVPIDLGHPGWSLRPLVVGPDEVPVVTDVRQAGRAPELAVLSAMAHGGRSQRDPVFKALLDALAAIDRDRATLYADVVLLALPKAARRELEAMMRTGTYEYQSEFVRRHVAEGEASALLTVLEARGIAVPDEALTRIVGCTDYKLIELWVRHAATAESIDEVFA